MDMVIPSSHVELIISSRKRI